MTVPGAGRREWMGLAVIALPCLLYSMDLTVLERRVRPAFVMAGGLTLSAAGFGMLTQVETGSGLAILVWLAPLSSPWAPPR